MDWVAFYEGFSAGCAPWAFIDLTILAILWPLREFIWILRDPLTKHRLKILLGVDE